MEIELAVLCFLSALSNPILALGPLILFSSFGIEPARNFSIAALVLGLLFKFLKVR